MNAAGIYISYQPMALFEGTGDHSTKIKAFGYL